MNVIRGCDAPQLIRSIAHLLKEEHRIIDGEADRNVVWTIMLLRFNQCDTRIFSKKFLKETLQEMKTSTAEDMQRSVF